LKELFTEAFTRNPQPVTQYPTDQALSLYTPSDILQHPKKKLTDLLDRYFGQLTKPHHFAIDYGHGAAVAYELDYIKTLTTYNKQLTTKNLFTSPDGSFPAHETDTSRFSNYEKLSQSVQES
jgi:hypothetical protein